MRIGRTPAENSPQCRGIVTLDSEDESASSKGIPRRLGDDPRTQGLPPVILFSRTAPHCLGVSLETQSIPSLQVGLACSEVVSDRPFALRHPPAHTSSFEALGVVKEGVMHCTAYSPPAHPSLASKPKSVKADLRRPIVPDRIWMMT